MADAYALKDGEGWTGDFGPKFVIKAPENGTTNGFAFVDFTTVPGEEPQDHTHRTEDEIFYVIDGSVSFPLW